MIKTIKTEEKKSFLRVLPNYAKRVIEHPESKLVRILGLFSILPSKQDFVIMENAIPRKWDCLMFDLKGSTVGRHVGGVDSLNPPKGIVLKDLNFKRFGKKILLNNKEKVFRELVDDIRILKNCKLMDYSILVGIYNDGIDTRYSVGNGFSIAIIDFFQRYTIRKRLERV